MAKKQVQAAPTTPDVIMFTEDEKALIVPLISRIRTYQGLVNEATVSLNSAAQFLAGSKAVSLAEYTISEDGAAFVRRPQQTVETVN